MRAVVWIAIASSCGGRPEPAGTMLFTDFAGVNDLAVDSSAVYWTREDGVKKLALPVGANPQPIQLVSGQTETQQLAIDATSIYFTNAGLLGNYDGSVMRVGLDGSGLTTLVDRLLQPSGIAIDASYVYWTGGNGVFRIPLAGGNFDVLVFEVEAGPIAIDNAFIYYVDYTNHAVQRVALAGGAPTKLVDDVPSDVAVTPTSLVWTTQFTPGTTKRLDLAGGTPVTIATEDGDNVSYAIALDGDEIYWTTTRPVERVNLDGSGRQTLSPYEPNTRAIALDATHVYWANGNAELKVLPKP